MEKNKEITIYDMRETVTKSFIKDCMTISMLLLAFYINYRFVGGSFLLQLFFIFWMVMLAVKAAKKRIFKIKTKDDALAAINKIFEEQSCQKQ